MRQGTVRNNLIAKVGGRTDENRVDTTDRTDAAQRKQSMAVIDQLPTEQRRRCREQAEYPAIGSRLTRPT